MNDQNYYNPFTDEFPVENSNYDNEKINPAEYQDKEFDAEQILRDLTSKVFELKTYSEEIMKNSQSLRFMDEGLTSLIEKTDNFLVQFDYDSTNFKNVLYKIAEKHVDSIRIARLRIDDKFYENIEGFKADLEKYNAENVMISTKLSDANKNFFEFIKKWKYYFLLGLSVPLVMFSIVSYSAFKWYETAVQTRQEVRQALLKDLKKNGKRLYDADYVENLEKNTTVIQSWLKIGDSRSTENFSKFKEGFEAANSK